MGLTDLALTASSFGGPKRVNECLEDFFRHAACGLQVEYIKRVFLCSDRQTDENVCILHGYINHRIYCFVLDGHCPLDRSLGLIIRLLWQCILYIDVVDLLSG